MQYSCYDYSYVSFPLVCINIAVCLSLKLFITSEYILSGFICGTSIVRVTHYRPLTVIYFKGDLRPKYIFGLYKYLHARKVVAVVCSIFTNCSDSITIPTTDSERNSWYDIAV